MKLQLPKKDTIHFIIVDKRDTQSLTDFLKTVYSLPKDYYISDRACRAWYGDSNEHLVVKKDVYELMCFGARTVEEARHYWSEYPKATCYRTSQLLTSVYGEIQ